MISLSNIAFARSSQRHSAGSSMLHLKRHLHILHTTKSPRSGYKISPFDLRHLIARCSLVGAFAFDAVFDDPGVLLYLLERDPLLRIQNKELAFCQCHAKKTASASRLTLLIRSFASALMKGGTVISPLAILRCVMTGVSSKGASPTRNS